MGVAIQTQTNENTLSLKQTIGHETIYDDSQHIESSFAIQTLHRASLIFKQPVRYKARISSASSIIAEISTDGEFDEWY